MSNGPAADPAAAPVEGDAGGVLRLLRENGSLRNFWAGSAVSLLGSELSLIALPLLAVLALDAGALDMGLLTAAATLPNLLFSVALGGWVDRRGGRLPLMIAADVASAALLASIPVAWWLGALTIGQLYAVAFLAGTAAVVSDVSVGVVFAAIVPRWQIIRANQLFHGSDAVIGVAGKSLGGSLVQALGAPVAVACDAVSYLASALLLRRIRMTEPPPDAGPGRGHWRAGFRFIRRTPIIRASLLTTATVNLFTFAFYALFVLYATRSLGIAPALLGAMLAASAVGAVLGAVLAGTISRAIGVGRAFIAGAFLFPGALLLVPAATEPRPLLIGLLFAAMLGSGFGVSLQDVAANSITLALVPDAVRSRVAGAYATVNYGVRPLGAVLGGAVAASIGLRGAIWLAVVCASAGGLFLVASPVARLRELPETADPAGGGPP
jgi:MFS family permease